MSMLSLTLPRRSLRLSGGVTSKSWGHGQGQDSTPVPLAHHTSSFPCLRSVDRAECTTCLARN